MKILINAYSCSPNRGSEPGMAWNWIINLSRFCKIFVITEGQWQTEIEKALIDSEYKNNIIFIYNPISTKARKMASNQGDWRFYYYYRIWQKKALLLAKKIINENQIDIIHQLNMIGFREPGYLWKIENKPFIWGPIGGLKQFPLSYLDGADIKMKLFNLLKNQLNLIQLKHSKRVDKALKRADLLISSIPDSYNAIKKHKGYESVIIPETGCNTTDIERSLNFENEEFHILWVGKFDFRKQLFLALKALAATKNKKIILDIYGDGSTEQKLKGKELAVSLDITNQVIWHGNQSNEQVMNAMREAHLFFFTSVNEDTSTVVLEAISNRLPILCFNACGFGAIVTEDIGVKIQLTNPSQSVIDFSVKLNYLYNNRQILKMMSENCSKRQKELSWNIKAEKMHQLYKQLLTSNES
jgi:glycosyltransferase involved in cell wall biosynthesis